MSSWAEADILALQTNEFRDTQSSLYHGEHQCVISAPDPRVSFGGCEKDIDLGASQEANEIAAEALVRYGEHALDEGTVCWLPESDETKKRMDSSKASVTSPHAIVALRFQVIEKRTHERSIDMVKGKRRGSYQQTLLGECEEKPKGVPIGSDGVRTSLLLA